MIIVDEFLKNMQSRLVASVHDSVVLDIHPDEASVVVPTVKYIMENLPIDFLKFAWNGEENVQYPIGAESEVGSSYGDVFETTPEEFNAFKTAQDFTDYKIAESYIVDSYESEKISEEVMNKYLAGLEARKPKGGN